MKLSHNKALYEELFTEMARMHDEVEYRKHLNAYQGPRGKWKDYPCVSVGAKLDYVSKIGHHHYISTQQDFHPLLYCELTTRLGDLNNYSPYTKCQNKVGHCAENYAASGVLDIIVLEDIRNADILKEIEFTKAFRPRTWKSIDWCENCLKMFD